MGSLLPKPHTIKPGQEITAQFLNRLNGMIDRTLRGAGAVGVQDFGDRMTVTLSDTKPVLPASSNYLQQFVVILELYDLLICVSYDAYHSAIQTYAERYSSTLGLDDIAVYYVAKPYALQLTPWHGQDIILGGYKVSTLPHSTAYGGDYEMRSITYFDNQIGQRLLSVSSYYDTPGDFTIPTVIGTKYVVECWGAGAGGHSISGDGGGGGAYTRKFFTATAPNISAHIGAPGLADSDGGDTWAISLADCHAGGGFGNTGGIAFTGDRKQAGGAGGAGSTTLGAGGGGSGRTNEDGFAGLSAQDSNGQNVPLQGRSGMGQGRGGDGGNPFGVTGSSPGGGGGGRGPNSPAGAGAPGRIRFSVASQGITQTITPNYQIGEIITVAKTITGYFVQPDDLTKPPFSVDWMDMNTAGRSWVSPTAQGIQVLVDVYCDPVTEQLVKTYATI